MDYWNRKELKCVSGFMAVREHTRNGKKSPVQNKLEDNVSLASLFHSKIRAGAINYGLQTVVLARCLSTLLRLGRESTVGLSGRSPSVDTEHLFSLGSYAYTSMCTNVVQAVITANDSVT